MGSPIYTGGPAARICWRPSVAVAVEAVNGFLQFYFRAAQEPQNSATFRLFPTLFQAPGMG